MTDNTKESIKDNFQSFKRNEIGIYEGVVRPLMQAGIDRKDRFIRVCCWCNRWWTGAGWQVENLPVGKQTHTYCPLCYDVEMKEVEK